jgi:DNA replication protein DnaC
MSSIAAELRIRTHAKRLHLPVTGVQAARYAEEAAQARHGTLEFLAALLDAEVAQRDANVERARIAQARFPELKELSDFTFAHVPSLNAPLVGELARGTYITRREVILAVGPPGTGKTHTAIGLGLAACRQARRVRFTTVAELVMELSEAQAQHRLSKLEEQLDRIDLLICDELGFVRLDADQAQLLFILLAHRYTRGALIITSNLEFADWTSVFNDDARLVAALLDRLTHRCHLLQFRGESYRFRESLAARESAPSPVPAAPRRRTSTPPVDPTEDAHITT